MLRGNLFQPVEVSAIPKQTIPFPNRFFKLLKLANSKNNSTFIFCSLSWWTAKEKSGETQWYPIQPYSGQPWDQPKPYSTPVISSEISEHSDSYSVRITVSVRSRFERILNGCATNKRIIATSNRNNLTISQKSQL